MMVVGRRSSEPIAKRRRPLHVPPRIVLAEDDPEMRKIIAAAMRKDGFTVTELPDGGRLLMHVVIGAENPENGADLVITDMRMPGTSGLRVLKAAREIGNDVPFILFTAFGDEATRAEAEKHGATFFTKPFEIADLRAAVLRIFAGT